MLSFQYNKLCDKIQKSINNAADLHEILALLCEVRPTLSDQVLKVCQDGPKAINALHSECAKLRHLLNNISQRKVYRALDKLISNLKEVESIVKPSEALEEIILSLEEFANDYESYNRGYSNAGAAKLIYSATNLQLLLIGFNSGLEITQIHKKDNALDIPDTYKELNILIPGDLQLESIANKLHAISKIYIEICNLLGISLADNNLTLSKVESGSLWIKVFGNNRVISLMIDLLKAGASFIYRNHTDEGRLSAIPRKYEALDSALGYMKKLKEEGINVGEMEEQLQKSGVLIAKEINQILEGQLEISVNDELLSPNAEIQKSLQASKKQFLPFYTEEDS